MNGGDDCTFEEEREQERKHLAEQKKCVFLHLFNNSPLYEGFEEAVNTT
jgi:hypothetical protein